MYLKGCYNVEEIGKTVGLAGFSGSGNRFCLDFPAGVLVGTGERIGSVVFIAWLGYIMYNFLPG